MHFKFTRLLTATTLIAATSIPGLTPQSATAEVRFGKNVRIGGHDVSNQRFTKKRRGLYKIYKGKPKRPGCRWRKNRDGSKTKVCHLQRKKR